MSKQLSRFYDESFVYEIGVDEAGRGPMFGRVYVGAVVLPKVGDFSRIKDSKKFTSKKKIREVAEFIKETAIAYSVQYIENDTIDKINIREAVLLGMEKSITDVMQIIKTHDKKQLTAPSSTLLMIDGNDFRSYVDYDETTGELREIPHVTVEGGDGLYYSIAAASILAKVARDDYILDLCKEYPILVERYGLDTNMGYGTKTHMEGIKQYGICQWHRRSFGICKTLEPYMM